MRIVYFAHSLLSCWNHGNAHFLRGVLSELTRLGHQVRVLEPAGAWSLEKLREDHGEAGLAPFYRAYPELAALVYASFAEVEAGLEGADLVLVHEWNAPRLIAAVGRLRVEGGRFRLLFHDTHHRAVSAPAQMRAIDLSGYDGVLAFGEALAEVYRGWGWGKRVFVWHEAADVRRFHPPADEVLRHGLVWIGNWGDDERSEELERFLLRPGAQSHLPLDIYGVRYPEAARATLQWYGARYRGWLANARAPEVFARHLATIHVPRRPYAETLPGIPTIRVFEALACGIPLICAPWRDCEGLFTPGRDYLVADGEAQMLRQLIALRDDADLRAALRDAGLATVLARHTCAHRARALLDHARHLGVPALETAA